MGATNIDGKFISSRPYNRLITECYKDQVNCEFNWYTGSIGMINTFREDEQIEDKNKIGYDLRNFIEKHKEIKTKEQAIEGYLYEKLRYCEVGELNYIVDNSTLAGYEVTTYGGYREVPLRTVDMDEIERELNKKKYVNKNRKGYTVFKIGHHRSGTSVRLEPCIEYIGYNRVYVQRDTLKEIEDIVKEDVVKWQHVFFAVKNNMSKVYMFTPNVKLQKNRVKSTETRDCSEAHPVYYAGMAPI